MERHILKIIINLFCMNINLVILAKLFRETILEKSKLKIKIYEKITIHFPIIPTHDSIYAKSKKSARFLGL